ncbi:hypothetical protein [Leptodesmis sp.]|uniref:hypothetical protein n=1 Tax=Leptodesmis sp. TaxID=3100501 RepID=UPI004053498F
MVAIDDRGVCITQWVDETMDYLHYLANTSLTLRVVEYLYSGRLPVQFLTVIHQIDGWIVRIKMREYLEPHQHGDFQAFMNELGVPYTPDIRVQMALWGLETGQSPVDVMQRYQVAIVSHGLPDREEIEEFRRQFVRGLGYCPETLA